MVKLFKFKSLGRLSAALAGVGLLFAGEAGATSYEPGTQTSRRPHWKAYRHLSAKQLQRRLDRLKAEIAELELALSQVPAQVAAAPEPAQPAGSAPGSGAPAVTELAGSSSQSTATTASATSSTGDAQVPQSTEPVRATITSGSAADAPVSVPDVTVLKSE